MHKNNRKINGLCSIACCLLPVQAANAHEIYAKAGFPGAGVGYAHSLNQHFGVRADFSSTGTIHQYGIVARKSHWDVDMKADHLGTYADWFPFGGSFRLSGGVHARTLEVNADSGSGSITIWGMDIPYGGYGDAMQMRTVWPKIAPYVGIGWSHHADQHRKFGFIADLGISFGSPRTELAISDPLRKKLDFLAWWAGSSVDTELERQRRELAAKVEMVNVIPHLFVGISYHF